MEKHRKRIRHFHEPGDCHELTFSCYRRRPLLSDDETRTMLCTAIDRAVAGHAFRLVAFVLMPEHVHLVVFPTEPAKSAVSDLLAAIKGPFSYRMRQRLQERDDPLLHTLVIRERPGTQTFRSWQEGPGYDRNLSEERTVRGVIDYLHLNPVRRGLVERTRDWKWSSARWYESDGFEVDPDLPAIHGLPPEFFR